MPILDPREIFPGMDVSSVRGDNFGDAVERLRELDEEKTDAMRELQERDNQVMTSRAATREQTEKTIQAERDTLEPANNLATANAEVESAELRQATEESEFIRENLAQLGLMAEQTQQHYQRTATSLEANRNIANGLDAEGNALNPLERVLGFLTDKQGRAYRSMRRDEAALGNIANRKATIKQAKNLSLETYPKVLALETAQTAEAQEGRIAAELELQKAGNKLGVNKNVLEYLVNEEGFDQKVVDNTMRKLQGINMQTEGAAKMLSTALQVEQLLLQYEQMSMQKGAQAKADEAMELMRPDFAAAMTQYNELFGTDVDPELMLQGMQNPNSAAGQYADANRAAGNGAMRFMTAGNRDEIMGNFQKLTQSPSAEIINVLSEGITGGPSNSSYDMLLRTTAKELHQQIVENTNTMAGDDAPPEYDDWIHTTGAADSVRQATMQKIRQLGENPQQAMAINNEEMDTSSLSNDADQQTNEWRRQNPGRSATLTQRLENGFSEIIGIASPEQSGTELHTAVSQTNQTQMSERMRTLQEENPEMDDRTALTVAFEEIMTSIDMEAQTISKMYRRNADRVQEQLGSAVSGWPAKTNHGSAMNGVIEYNFLEPVEVQQFLIETLKADRKRLMPNSAFTNTRGGRPTQNSQRIGM